MKSKALEMNVELSTNGLDLKVDVETAIIGKVGTILYDEEIKKIIKYTDKISQIISKAIYRDFENSIIEKVRKRYEDEKEMCEQLSSEGKKKLEGFDNKMEELETDEEKITFGISKILEELKRIAGEL